MSNHNDPLKGMPSEMRKIARTGVKAGWTWQLNHSGHYEVFTPGSHKATTVAPRNRHWRVRFNKVIKEFGYPIK